MILKIKNEELIKELVGEVQEFPRYTTQIMNLANQNSQGTRPKIVGQLSELIKECPDKTYEGWKKWYLSKHPKTIENASDKIDAMVGSLKEAILKINKGMIKKWVEDLVLEKTFVGMRFQEAILKKISSIKKVDYRLSTQSEESKGIDGFVGNDAISIKPITYKLKNALNEKINAKMVYYEKTKNGLNVDVGGILN